MRRPADIYGPALWPRRAWRGRRCLSVSRRYSAAREPSLIFVRGVHPQTATTHASAPTLPGPITPTKPLPSCPQSLPSFSNLLTFPTTSSLLSFVPIPPNPFPILRPFFFLPFSSSFYLRNLPSHPSLVSTTLFFNPCSSFSFLTLYLLFLPLPPSIPPFPPPPSLTPADTHVTRGNLSLRTIGLE